MIDKEKIGSASAESVTTGTTQTQCRRCVLDTSAPEIIFTETGCNFCDAAAYSLSEIRFLPPFQTEIVRGSGEYDVIIGLSGGVDSSYVLHKAMEYGLKPLCFTIDNGWNDPKADENIMRLVEGLKVPFFRYTIDQDKFRELQGAFLHAGVKNIEIPTDHILMAASLEMAAQYNIRTILSGGNVATESIMPASWGHNARDLIHIKSIYRRFVGKELTGLPLCSVWMWNIYKWMCGIRTVYLLDYIEYNRAWAIKVLEANYGYKPYGDKHCESIWTTWFQNFYLFEKFGIDKRKAHLSSLIASGQITRAQALEVLQGSPVYPELGIEARVLKYPPHEHEEYPMDKWYGRIASIVRLFV